MGSNPSVASTSSNPDISLKNDTYPVQNVTFCDAVTFANKLSAKEGFQPAYTGVEQCASTEGKSVRWNLASDGYRLPTEDEWEYAARAGSPQMFPGGSSYKDVCRVGNTSDLTAIKVFKFAEDPSKQCEDGYGGLAPVKSFPANAWGLYDVTGNVWEWCWSGYADSAGKTPDPRGTYIAGRQVFRGGSWAAKPLRSRVANRRMEEVSFQTNGLGIRLVRSAE